MTTRPAPLAPDFTLPEEQGEADTLKSLLARRAVLLVFASLPQLEMRLDLLKEWGSALDHDGVAGVVLINRDDIRSVYALYDQPPQETTTPIEFLTDRDGQIRARWRPGDAPDWIHCPLLQSVIAAMDRLKLTPVAPTGHVHEG